MQTIEDAGDAYHHTGEWGESDYIGECSWIEKIDNNIAKAREAIK